MPPFLTQVTSDSDLWMFVGSNNAITAGRCNPDHAIFPYYTQDRMFDLAHTIGSKTIIRIDSSDTTDDLWEPWSPTLPAERIHSRSVAKTATGSRIVFEETHPSAGLSWRHTWTTADRFGILRRSEIRNNGNTPVRLTILDGFINLLPAGIDQDFQTRFSNLADAYKKSELLTDSGIGVYYLSSVPTDRAEPSEGLRSTVAWTTARNVVTHLLCEDQVAGFRTGAPTTTETDIRGRRGAYLIEISLTLPPGESASWWIVADTGLDAAALTNLAIALADLDDADAALAEAALGTDHALLARVAEADGIQATADTARAWRHLSNTLFNLMRGGTFADGGLIPRDAFLARLQRADRALAEKHHATFAALPDALTPGELRSAAATTGDPDLMRHAGEFLPLTFGRRHGDPSRPWNRFSIDIRDASGRPQLAYQGNWRDIFQNWEALLQSFPEYTQAAIFRFLNSSTADGHNPYKIHQDGFDWETIDPEEPWSNIGYWGDHQIIYLLKLLEHAERVHPGDLGRLLDARLFTFADVPYRIRPYQDILRDPRNTVDYDDAAEAAIRRRVAARGTDGQLLVHADGTIARASLIEKLLITLLARLANFVPDGGIWMNTQRPEWNDANNALVGYGISVVTLGYVHRYLTFLIRLLRQAETTGTLPLATEVAQWLETQARVFAAIPATPSISSTERRQILDDLGHGATAYREVLYKNGPSGFLADVSVEQILTFLEDARRAVAASLRGNRREDGLWHAYNLLTFEAGGGLGIRRLDEMLEGQVSILSAGLLAPDEAADLLDALRASRLWREDQGSYLLYPDRDLPRFLEKNRIPSEALAESRLLQAMLDAGDTSIVARDARGVLRFNGDFRNAGDVRAALERIRRPEWAELARQEGETIAALFESVFNHHAFKGRSGTFFAYEGLGSIYWHMVSKLLLAIQENHAHALASGADPSTVTRLATHYHRVLEGLGIHKSPSRYGAFPTDAYSHTPAHAGAQQPGMTGQVKEDILTRLGELGVHVADGVLRFDPRLLDSAEFTAEATELPLPQADGSITRIPVLAGSIAFTLCAVPVIYRTGAGPALEIHRRDGAVTTRDEPALTREESAAIFSRRHDIAQLVVRPDASGLFHKASPNT